MTGDAPQPGQTPRNEGTPFAWSDPGTGAWWGGDLGPQETHTPAPRRHAPTLEPPKPAEHVGEAAEAHEAGEADTSTALAGIFEAPPGPDQTKDLVPAKKRRKPRPTAAPVLENTHDEVDAERFNTEGSTISYAARAVPEPEALSPDHEPTIVDLLAALPVDDPRPEPARPEHLDGETVDGAAAQGVQETVLLPDPERNRPTVILPQSPGRKRFGRGRDDRARADRALQDRVRAEHTAALLETSPFWRTEEERAREAAWPPQATREKLGAGLPPRRKPRHPRRPLSGLVALLTLGLVAAFFSWVSAEPFWLATGHGRDGTATVSRCTGSGVSQRCVGTFAAADGSFSVENLSLLGVDQGARASGSTGDARMVSITSRQAYVGSTGPLVHLRWILGFVLVLLCGLGIAGLTGAGRLETMRARRGALAVSVAGPLLLLAGFLFATY